MKLAPFTVSGNAILPAITLDGLMLLTIGFTGAVTGKLSVFEGPPKETPLSTMTGNDPVAVIYDAGMATVISLEPKTLGDTECPPTVTVQAGSNFFPRIVSVNPGDPALTDAGEKALISGLDLLTGSVV